MEDKDVVKVFADVTDSGWITVIWKIGIGAGGLGETVVISDKEEEIWEDDVKLLKSILAMVVDTTEVDLLTGLYALVVLDKFSSVLVVLAPLVVTSCVIDPFVDIPETLKLWTDAVFDEMLMEDVSISFVVDNCWCLVVEITFPVIVLFNVEIKFLSVVVEVGSGKIE